MTERPPAPKRPTTARPLVSRPARVDAPLGDTAVAHAPLMVPGAMVIDRAGTTTGLPLVDGGRYVIGRHDAADVVFDDDDVSRLHGVLTVTDGGATYEDYGSQNGSVVARGGVVVTVAARAPVPVGVGDVIELGAGGSAVRLVARLPDAEQRAQRAQTEVSAAAKLFSERLKLAARTRVPVFLLGPSGVGKTHSARKLHEASRLPGAFVPVNCARLPTDANALHSELLGHVRGAYTGAESARAGKLVLADGGTLFLDEVESLPPVAQGFLLDVLEGSGDLAPLGAGAMRLKPITFRLVSASKRPLASSGLRADLCERLAEGHLWRVPGLSERADDIPGLLVQFAREQSSLLGVDVLVDERAVAFAARASWPGQIRQLRATVVALAQLGLARHDGKGQGARVVITDGDVRAHLLERAEVFDVDATPPVRGDARRLTRAQAEAALATHGGNQVKAARALGVARNTLRKKLLDDDGED